MARHRKPHMPDVEPLPDGEYMGLIAYIAADSDFADDEAAARLRAAFPGREVRPLPVPWNRAVAVVAARGVAFVVEQPPGPDERRRADVRRALEILRGFRGVTAVEIGQGGAVYRQGRADP